MEQLNKSERYILEIIIKSLIEICLIFRLVEYFGNIEIILNVASGFLLFYIYLMTRFILNKLTYTR